MENKRVREACDRTPTHLRKKMGRAQRGMAMISALIMVIVFGAILTLWAERESQRTRGARADAIGDAMAVLGDHLDTYIKDNHKAIVAGTALSSPDGAGGQPVQISNARVITVGQLIKLMHIRGAGVKPPYMPQSDYAIRIDVDGCQAGSDDHACKITGLIYITHSIVTRGRPDPLMAARAAQKLGRNGGFTTADEPEFIRFNDGNGNVPEPIQNPVPNTPIGILARRIGDVYSALNEDYLPRDGSKSMRGALKMSDAGESYDISGVKKLDAQYAEINGGLWIKGNHYRSDYGLWAGNWDNAKKTAMGQPVGIKASGDIEALGNVLGKDVRAGDRLMMINNIGKSEGDSCQDEPHFIRSGSRILTCQNGRYTGLGDGRAVPLTGCSRREYNVSGTDRRLVRERDCGLGATVIDPRIVRFKLRFFGRVGLTGNSRMVLGRFLSCQREVVGVQKQTLADPVIFLNDQGSWSVQASNYAESGWYDVDVHCFGELN